MLARACPGFVDRTASNYLRSGRQRVAHPAQSSHLALRLPVGKFIALFVSLSAVTWIPCLLLFAYEGYSSPTPWIAGNLRIAGGLLADRSFGLRSSHLSAWRCLRGQVEGRCYGHHLRGSVHPGRRGRHCDRGTAHKMGFLLNLPFMITSLWRQLLELRLRSIQDGRSH